MKATPKHILILIDTSVLLSAVRSPSGGSGTIIKLIQKKILKGCISETILDEALRHAHKIPMPHDTLQREIYRLFPFILPPPKEKTVDMWQTRMLDQNDTHLFATYEETKSNYLVSLDKRHILALKGKFETISIVSPGELLQLLKVA